jgi:protein-tyrosine phosphatase
MIDVHCHILPGIDDGAQNLTDSIELINIAISDGITHIVATPHIHPGRFDNNIATINTAYNKLVEWIKHTNTPIKLSTAAEVRISVELLSMLESNVIPYVGQWEGDNVMLLEMPHSHILPGSDKLIKLLLNNNIRPLIAHPERNKEIMADPSKIQPFIDQGCLLQVTAGSLVGRFGDSAQAIALQLCEQNLVTLIATDAHNKKHRPPKLAEAYTLLDKEIGGSYSQQLKSNVEQLVSTKTFND